MFYSSIPTHAYCIRLTVCIWGQHIHPIRPRTAQSAHTFYYPAYSLPITYLYRISFDWQVIFGYNLASISTLRMPIRQNFLVNGRDFRLGYWINVD